MAEMPFIAVVGGLAELKPKQAEAARAMARIIGCELAKAGFGLVVYSAEERFIDPHVVAGYVEAKPARGAVLIRYPQSLGGKVHFAGEDAEAALFRHQVFPGEDWESPFYRSLTEEDGIDAVLLLAGGQSTLIAGQIALARRIPVLPIGLFAGSAQKIWNQAVTAQEGLSSEHRPVAELIAELKQRCAAAHRRRQEARRRERAFDLAVATRRKMSWAAGSVGVFLLFAGVAIVGRQLTVDVFNLIVLGGLMAAGATGASVRSVLHRGGDDDPFRSIILGAIAGLVVGLAYLIPQWVTNIDLFLSGTRKVEAANSATTAVVMDQLVQSAHRLQFLIASLVAITAGIGFEAVFARLRQQAAELPVNVTKLGA